MHPDPRAAPLPASRPAPGDPPTRESPHPCQGIAAANRVSVRSSRDISGGVKASRCSWSLRDQSRKQTPGATRPARPARCSALARLIFSVSSVFTPRRASKSGIRARPLSITVRIPGRVSEVSAMFVETITRGRSPLPIARSCAAASRSPCNGNISQPRASRRFSSASTVRMISYFPGMKTSMSASAPEPTRPRGIPRPPAPTAAPVLHPQGNLFPPDIAAPRSPAPRHPVDTSAGLPFPASPRRSPVALPSPPLAPPPPAPDPRPLPDDVRETRQRGSRPRPPRRLPTITGAKVTPR
jgi:hypothetical protein